MPIYTQEELLNTEFNNADRGILGGLIKNGLYIMGANSKIGKSMIATALANAVANGTEYLGKTNRKGKVIYYDNDNYDYEVKARIQALGLGKNSNIRYVFGEDARSLQDIKNDIKYSLQGIEEYSLVIIDSFIGLREFLTVDDNYKNIYPILKDFRNFIVERNLACIFLHHIKKGYGIGQDLLLGTKALSGATTGTIIVNVANEFSTVGKIEFMLRHKKEIIPIKKDSNQIGWILADDEDDVVEEIPKNILNLINSVIVKENHQLLGTAQEIVQKAKMEINPNALYKYLVKNEIILKQNGIVFEKKRTHEHRKILVKYELGDG